VYNVPCCYTCHRGNNIPLASINQADIPNNDAGVVILPPQIRGR
jgi:photosynthetic reaction center cytochrome c subunit